MLQYLITSMSFWASVLIPATITLVLFIILFIYWNNSFVSKPEPVILHAESLQNPINTGITAAFLVIPLLSSLVAYLYVKVSSAPNEFSLLVASLVVFSFSIIIGFWNNYSFATLTRNDGTIEITKEKNIFIPAFFVSQLALLLSAIILVVIFCFLQLSPLAHTTKIVKTSSIFPILRQPLRIEMSKDTIVSLWGQPERETKKGTDILYIYKTPNSRIEITISNDKIIRIIEE